MPALRTEQPRYVPRPRADRPNATTLAAFEEIEKMKTHPDEYKGYTDIDQMFEELLA